MNGRPRTPLSVFTILHLEAHIRRTLQRILYHRHDLVIQASSHKNWKQQIKKERNDGDRCTDSSKKTTSSLWALIPSHVKWIWGQLSPSHCEDWTSNVKLCASGTYYIVNKRFCLALFLFLWGYQSWWQKDKEKLQEIHMGTEAILHLSKEYNIKKKTTPSTFKI